MNVKSAVFMALLSASAATAAFSAPAHDADRTHDARTIWNVKAFDAPPAVFPVEIPSSNDYGRVKGVKPIFYAGEPLEGKPTRVFAWLGLPKGASAERKVPAIVLVHGGGGTAFAKWVATWNARGYAAIAMDTNGSIPQGERDGRPHPRHAFSGPPGWGASVAQIGRPIGDQWTYHAIAAIMRAHSLVRSLPEVDAERTGITGISWGGYLTSIAMGVDGRFKFAAPVYGCGWYELNPQWRHMDADESKQRAWYDLWDPKNYISGTKCKVLWCTGTNDRWYPLNSLRRSYDLLPAATPLSLSLKHRMPHGHPPAGDPKEIAAFADHVLKGAPAPVEIESAAVSDGRLHVRFDAHGRRVAKAQLLSTTDANPVLTDRAWTTTAVDGFSGESPAFSVPVPTNAVMFFVNLVTDDGLVSSTRIFGS